MENNENWFNDKKLELNNTNLTFLKETAKWTKFMAVMGYIGIGIMALGGIFGGSMLAEANAISGRQVISPIVITITYLLFAAIYWMPVQYMWRFSVKMESGIKSSIQAEVDSAFENLKSHFKYVAILTIVILSIYALIIIIAIVAALAAAM